jgi:hypothetical protein
MMAKEKTLGDMVRAADTLGLELHVRLTAKSEVASYRCRYCHGVMRVRPEAYDENPFCKDCLHERMENAPHPLDAARMACGLPVRRS